MDKIWSIHLLGRLRLSGAERTVDRFRTQKAASILAYLAYNHHRSHPREALIDLVWPEAEIESARHNLSLALSSLRHQLEPPGIPAGSVIVADRYSVELNPEAFGTDVMEFERALREAARATDESAKARSLKEAVELYRGPLLPGFYEDWVLNEQSRLAERFVQAAIGLVRILSGLRDHAGALEMLRRAIAIEPLREDLHGAAMRLLVAMGQPAAALEQYCELERLLAQELGNKPGAPIQRLARQILDMQPQWEPESEQPAGPQPVPNQIATPSHPARLPAGTVTFLMTDIEGSTARWEQEGEAFRATLKLHHAVLRREFQRHGGIEVKEAGDSFLVAFQAAADALACAVAAQQALCTQIWPEGSAQPKVRMSIHSGDVELEDGEYHGLTLHRAARILEAAHGGQILCSEAVYGLLRRDLESDVRLRDLGVYRLRDVELAERLFQVERVTAEAAAPVFPPLNADRAHRDALPIQLTRFFGREEEIESLARLLSTAEAKGGGSRLVTLTGMGGTGKTRLAIETARKLLEEYSGTVYFVPLADLADPRLLPEAILGALGEQPPPNREPIQLACEILSRRPALLILDNIEQLLGEASAPSPAVDSVEYLRGHVPSLAILVTSRQILGLEGEREFPVPPLSTPGSAGDSEMTAERMSMYECVRLFIDRAQAVRPDFEVTNRNAPAIAEICARLEGIPLAIELAAARAQVFTPTQMLQQLAGSSGGRFDLLVSRKRGVSERQRTLRDTIAWSYRLLAPPLQQAFGRLSVFRGGWTVDAAEAVCDDGSISAAGPAIDYLAQLRECSLILTEEGPGGIRFRMLETLREFAREQLDGEDLNSTEARHAACFLALAEEAEPELRGENQAEWLDRLDAAHENFRAALAHALRCDPEIAIRLCCALWFLWSIRGRLTEGRRHLDAALLAAPADHPTLGRSALRARALAAAGSLAHDQSDYPSAGSLLEESVSLWRALATESPKEKSVGLAQSLVYLANVRLDESAPDQALPLYQEALGLYREAGDERGAAMALGNLGILHLQRGDFDHAAELLAESIRLKRKLGNLYGQAMSLEALGNLERSRGNADLALAHCREALEIRRGLGHRQGIAMSINNLGHLLLETGDVEGARGCLRESLDLFLELDEPRGAIESLTGLAGTAAAQGKYEAAALLMGAMEAQRHERNLDPRPCEKAVIKRWKGQVRSELAPDVFESTWNRGRALDWERAIELTKQA